MSEGAQETRPPLVRALGWPVRIAYAIFTWTTFLVMALTVLAIMLFTPGIERRRALARAGARFFLWSVGMPVRVQFAERLPEGQCIVVANHASYLDGVVFKAALPPRFSFVIKREMNDMPLAGFLLRRIGSHFVDRNNRNRGAADARRVLRTATSGHSLVFFPEGTFSPEPGLMRFHTGAFATAARAQCPVVPVVVRGTRRALPPATALPWPGPIEMEILPPVLPRADGTEDAAVEMRDRARLAILDRLGEPDRAAA